MENLVQFSWLNTPGVQRVSQALGGENLRFVGGCVRDSLLGRPVNDLDACTPFSPDEVMSRLQKADINVIPTGLKHGTVTAVASGTSIEITTLRRDVETDGRRAEVSFTEDWSEDAKRRDFTINALYLTVEGAIYDPVGGLGDLKESRVRFIGKPRERIGEDALRILRFFRFTLGYSNGPPDPEGLAAALEKMAMLKILSKERIRDELVKILEHPDPSSILDLMRKSGCFPYVLPEKFWVSVPLKHMKNTNANVRFLSLIRREKKVVKEAAKILRLKNSTRAHLLNILDCQDVLKEAVTQYGLLYCLYYFGRLALEDALILCGEESKVHKLPQSLTFPLKGKDLIEAGNQAGPVIGKMLKDLEIEWLKSECRKTKEQLLKLAAAYPSIW
ncbi:CCA tRNA nucleotidyltransferase [Temperatibacter marinus]|uniref:CCA tRNA nucleotidyltransferase n=1 Tax=Temperatibacter marinus TaxID=1456591 RepID=A0AA52EBX4_9PROT|nr:CCA tRNA nucleotidyltransferase [Temperatibacter marinus]WND01966.1 CCA tRNA nucleotidyltransferase [Temperatibacter marinus]